MKLSKLTVSVIGAPCLVEVWVIVTWGSLWRVISKYCQVFESIRDPCAHVTVWVWAGPAGVQDGLTLTVKVVPGRLWCL
jgi:hypothetical protein